MKTRQHMFAIFLLNIALIIYSSAFDNEEEEALRLELMTNYTKQVRPSQTTQVNMTLVLLSLNELNIGEQFMSITSILYTEWADDRLSRSVSGSAVSAVGYHLVFDSSEVWTPPIIVDNSITDTKLVGHNSIPVETDADGLVLWAPPLILKTSCEMSIVFYPFEYQECAIHFFVYGYNSTEVLLTPPDNPINVQYFSKNAGWLFQSAYTEEMFLTDNKRRYRILKYILKFKRRWLFLALTLMLPTIMNLCLMLGVFFLPTDSGEKMGYSLTVLLGYIVLLTLVGDNLPDVSTEISILQAYLASVLVVGCLTTLLSIWVITVYNKDIERNPITQNTKTVVKWVVLPITHVSFWFVLFRKLKSCIANKIKGSKENKIADEKVASDPDNFENEKQVENQVDSPKPQGLQDLSFYTLNCPLTEESVRSVSSRNSQTVGSKTPISISSLGDFDFKSTQGLVVQQKGHHDKQPCLESTNASSIAHVMEEKDEIEELLFNLDWKQISILMDSFFLRTLGGILLLFTFFMITMFFIQY